MILNKSVMIYAALLLLRYLDLFIDIPIDEYK
jgi:hypothetical protein